NPILTRVSNMRRLRSGSIGSMSAWFPSRKSTEHQRGAFTSCLLGQVRSGRESGMKARYLSKAIFFGVAGRGGMSFSPRVEFGLLSPPEIKNLLATLSQEARRAQEWRSPLHK